MNGYEIGSDAGYGRGDDYRAITYENFHLAYIDQLRLVYRCPSHYNSPRGYPSRERLAAQFCLLDPRQRIPFVPARRTNIIFGFAEALWYLAGRDDLSFIAYYAPSMSRYSADGRTLTGTAYGKKILSGFGRRSQWDEVIAQLKDDPDSKRAVLQIFDASELRVPGNTDVSCTLGLQFLLRERRLHTVAYMRANDAYRGMVSDVFSFTFLQEFLATELGAHVGTYTHVAGSLHVYASDDRRVEAVLEDPAASAGAPFVFPAMPAMDNWAALRVVLEMEEALRTNRHALDLDTTALGLPHYWCQVLILFEFYRRLRHGAAITLGLTSLLDPVFRYFVQARWAGAPATAGPFAP